MSASKEEAAQSLTPIVAQSRSGSLQMNDLRWKSVNPKYSMVARILVNMLDDEAVISRLLAADNAEELKIILIIDAFLALIKDPESKLQIRELLADSKVSLAVILRYVALSFAWGSIRFYEEPSGQTYYYTVEGASRQLRLLPEELYQAVFNGKIKAELCIPQAEIEKFLSKRER